MRGVAQEMTAEIDWARAQRAAPEAYRRAAAEAGRRTHAAPAQVADVFARYEHLKNQRRLVDFDDLLSLARTEVERDPGYAAAIRWRFRHLFVDEFQDVNPLQHALLEAWRGGRADLCVVGDPHQAIYGWNGADGRWLESFAEHHPGATILRLRHSHRSSPQIVALGHAILTGGGRRSAAGHPPRRGRTAPGALRPRAQRSRRRGCHRAGRQAAGRTLALHRRSGADERAAGTGGRRALAGAGIPARRRGRPSEDPVVAAALAELRSVTGPGSLRSWLEETLAGPSALADEPAATEHEDGTGAALPRALRARRRGPAGPGAGRGRPGPSDLAVDGRWR